MNKEIQNKILLVVASLLLLTVVYTGLLAKVL